MRNLCVLLLCLAACSGGDVPPEGVLERGKFKGLLLEAQLIEARRHRETVIDRRPDVPVRQYYDSLFAKEDVTADQFITTFEYYSERPEELKAIYEEILAELGERQDGDQ